MILSAVFLLASPAPVAATVPLAQLTRQDCPAPTFDKERGEIGDRAIISDDGSKAVVQCGDGVVRFWQSGETAFKPIGVMPLFGAAQVQGMVPAGILCPWPSMIRDTTKSEADCDILDHDDAKRTYILRNAETNFAFVVSGQKVLRESTVQQKFGALLPNKNITLAIVDRQQRPELLQSLAASNGSTSLLARLPSPNLVFEDGEGSADTILYSTAYKSIIVAFGGAFRVATDMTYVRAFNEQGVEQWKISGKLPPRNNDELIVGNSTKLATLAAGRYALMAKESAPSSSELIDLKDGSAVSVIGGWPLATSRDATAVLVKGKDDTLSLMKLNLPGAN